MSDLAGLQRWLLQVVTAPAGPEEGARAAAVQTGWSAAEVVAHRRGVLPLRRLGVYASGYFIRLLECLRAEYPALRKTLGSDVFDALARSYLVHRPPSSYTLTDLGEGFPAFLEATRPPDEHLEEEARGLVALPIELARLERAFSETIRGEGSEGGDWASLEILGNAVLPDVCFKVAPNLSLLHVRLSITAYFDAVRCGGELPPGGRPPLAKRPIPIAVSRSQWRTSAHELEPWQVALIVALRAGESLRAAETSAAMASGVTPEYVRARAPVWLDGAANRGYFVAVLDSPE